MGKVIKDTDAANRTAQLHAAPDVLETRQRLQSLVQRYADMTRGEQRGEGVGTVVLAMQ